MKRDPFAAPQPDIRATALMVAGLITTPIAAIGAEPSALAHSYAVWVALSILGGIAVDFRRNLRNLVRADLMAIGAFYFLTLFEFLFPQPGFNAMVTLEETRVALLACVAGFAGLAVGRHLPPPAPRSLQHLLSAEFAPRTLITIYSLCLFGAYFYMLLSVDFDFFEMVRQIMGPRFTQSWSRERLGDWRALMGEFGMVVYLIPPIAGVVLARKHQFTRNQKLYVAAGFLFTVFAGFVSGTRNVFATYLATFLVAFAFANDPRRKRELVTVGGAVAAVMLLATVVMLQFRNIGFSNYLAGLREGEHKNDQTQFFVDYNLYVIAKLADVFPAQHDYLGFEIPYLSIIRPIPRAIWSGKPEGLSISIEDAVGVEGLTLASSFAGEAYMSGGLIGVFATGLAFGAITAWWNRFGRADNSTYGHLIFASGFFAAVISMRSMFVFTTAILPTIAGLVAGQWLLDSYRVRRRAVRAADPPADPPAG
jgi:oligosaccharide repeat unit polymerase